MLHFENLTISPVNSSDEIAYLPLNCFLTKDMGGTESTSFKWVDLSSISSPSLTSLQEFPKNKDKQSKKGNKS